MSENKALGGVITVEELEKEVTTIRDLHAKNMLTLDTALTFVTRVVPLCVSQAKELQHLGMHLDKLKAEVVSQVQRFEDQVSCSNLRDIANEAVQDHMDYHDWDYQISNKVNDVVCEWFDNNFDPSDFETFDDLKGSFEELSEMLKDEYKELKCDVNTLKIQMEQLPEDTLKEPELRDNCVLEVRTDHTYKHINYIYMRIEGKLWALREELLPGEDMVTRKIWPAEEVKAYKCWEPARERM